MCIQLHLHCPNLLHLLLYLGFKHVHLGRIDKVDQALPRIRGEVRLLTLRILVGFQQLPVLLTAACRIILGSKLLINHIKKQIRDNIIYTL